MLVHFHGGPLHGQQRDVRESPNERGELEVEIPCPVPTGRHCAACAKCCTCRTPRGARARYTRRSYSKTSGRWLFYYVEEATS